MDIQIVFFLAVLGFVLVVLINAIRISGFVFSSDDVGFVMNTIFQARKEVSWSQVERPARLYEAYFPRVVIRLKSRGVLGTSAACVVFLRNRAQDTDFIERLNGAVGVKNMTRLEDIFGKR